MGKRCGRREVKQRGKWEEGSVKERRKRNSREMGRGKKERLQNIKES